MGNGDSKPKNNAQKQLMIKNYIEQLEKNEPQDPDGDVEGGEIFKEAATKTFTSAASQSNPEKLRAAYMKAHSIVDETDSLALAVNPSHLTYPFQNLILEGGGNKGLAYVGAVKCFEELNMMQQIKRIGGTSAGAITAALVAFGYKSDEILTFLSADIEEVFMDHSCGYFSLLPNLIRKFGWNPGNKIHAWFGTQIENKTGSPDTTFYELYKLSGVELCIVVTNLNLMTAQYCHVKTTPNMPIRDALRMTMAIPGVFSAIPYDNHGSTDVFVDGGVLVNYPINCFDGWFLSMDKQDSFLSKVKSLDELPQMMASSNRFKPTGPNKTIGFLLFDEAEREIMRFALEGRVGTLQPERPSEDTPLYLAKEEKKRDKKIAQKAHARIVAAVDNFLAIIQRHNLEDQEFVTKDELKAVLADAELTTQHREILFGKDVDLDKAFHILDKDGNNKISFYELIQFIDERGVRMQVRFQGYSRREVNNFPAFLMAMQETLLTNLKFTAVNESDEKRTVGINTGHVGTMDYNLVDADRDFIVERGYNATLSFLRYYAAENPDQVKQRPESDTVQSSQPTSIHQSDKQTSNNGVVSEKDVLLEEKSNKNASS